MAPFPVTALIGCGRIGFLLEDDPLRNKPCTHFGGCRANGISITHAVDINSERLSRFAQTAGISSDSCFTDYVVFFQNVKPHLVIIATPTDTHAQIAVKAAESGAKLIILEKPISHSLKSAKRIIKACKDNAVMLIVNHERRFAPAYNEGLKILGDGLIGQVRTAHASILTGPYRGNSDISEGGGPLLHDGTHMLDLIRFLLGDIASLRGEIRRDSRNTGYEDSALAWLKTSSGQDVFLEAGGSRKYFHFELDISAESGRLVVGNGINRLFLKDKSKYYSGFNDLSEVKFPDFSSESCFTKLYDVASTLLSGDYCSEFNGIDGYRALEAVHAVYLSSSLGGKEIKLPVHPRRVKLGKIFGI